MLFCSSLSLLRAKEPAADCQKARCTHYNFTDHKPLEILKRLGTVEDKGFPTVYFIVVSKKELCQRHLGFWTPILRCGMKSSWFKPRTGQNQEHLSLWTKWAIRSLTWGFRVFACTWLFAPHVCRYLFTGLILVQWALLNTTRTVSSGRRNKEPVQYDEGYKEDDPTLGTLETVFRTVNDLHLSDWSIIAMVMLFLEYYGPFFSKTCSRTRGINHGCPTVRNSTKSSIFYDCCNKSIDGTLGYTQPRIAVENNKWKKTLRKFLR